MIDVLALLALMEGACPIGCSCTMYADLGGNLVLQWRWSVRLKRNADKVIEQYSHMVHPKHVNDEHIATVIDRTKQIIRRKIGG